MNDPLLRSMKVPIAVAVFALLIMVGNHVLAQPVRSPEQDLGEVAHPLTIGAQPETKQGDLTVAGELTTSEICLDGDCRNRFPGAGIEGVEEFLFASTLIKCLGSCTDEDFRIVSNPLPRPFIPMREGAHIVCRRITGDRTPFGCPECDNRTPLDTEIELSFYTGQKASQEYSHTFISHTNEHPWLGWYDTYGDNLRARPRTYVNPRLNNNSIQDETITKLEIDLTADNRASISGTCRHPVFREHRPHYVLIYTFIPVTQLNF